MAEFYFNVPEIQKLGGNWDSINTTVSDVYKMIDNASSGLGAVGLESLTSNFQAIETGLTTHQKKVGALSGALTTIVSIFTRKEENIFTFAASLIESVLAFFERFFNGGVPLEESSNDGTADGTEYVSPSGTTYTIGDATQPEYNYDDDFPYDPDATPTASDYFSYLKWSVIAEGVDDFGGFAGLSDAGDVYYHYMNGNGEDYEIDFEGAYYEDSNVQAAVDYYVNDLQRTVDEMIANGQQPPFSITGDLIPINGGYYPSTENWQKTIGAYNMWISADVSIDSNGNIVMNTTVHEIDRYNFNRGMQDIASGTPDDVNGRFEELGWAHSFTTTGEMDLNVTWTQGDVPSADEAHYGGGR